jgi:hypothetical protein
MLTSRYGAAMPPGKTARDEHRWRHMEPLRQGTNLPDIQPPPQWMRIATTSLKPGFLLIFSKT